jgi:hypothetical protein
VSTKPASVVQVIIDEAGNVPGLMYDSFPSGQQLALLDDAGVKISQQVLRDLRTGPGRRLGSKNKHSAQIGKLLVEKFGDPILSMANGAFMPTETLTKALRAADGDGDFDDNLDRLDRLVARLGARLTKEQASRLSARLFKMMARPSISSFDVWREQNALKKSLAEYAYGKAPVQSPGSARPDAILNVFGITDPEHLAQRVGEYELSDEEISQIKVSDGENGADFDNYDDAILDAFLDDGDE